MCFCKKNIYISNVINTFLSLSISIICESRSRRWRRTHVSCACLLKSREFVYRSKGSKVSLLYQRKTSLLLAYIEILQHFSFEKPRFVLLFHAKQSFKCKAASSLPVYAARTNQLVPSLLMLWISSATLIPIRLRHLEFHDWTIHLYNFKYGYFFLQKFMDLLHEAFILMIYNF